METERRIYEGMFLVDSAEAASDWDGINAAIDRIFERANAEVLYKKKWDECKLAYEIKGKTRGTYFLTYFKVDGDRVKDIERDVILSEKILRALFLRGDHVTEAELAKDTPAGERERRATEAIENAEKAAAAAAPESEPIDEEAVSFDEAIDEESETEEQ